MRIQVLFEGDVTDEAHATDAAVELDAAEDLRLGHIRISIHIQTQWVG